MATKLMRVVTDEVLVRSQPKRVVSAIVRNARLVYGQTLEVRADSRTEADGYVWWEHAQQPGWWSSSGKIGGAVYMEDYTPPTATTTPVTTTTSAAGTAAGTGSSGSMSGTAAPSAPTTPAAKNDRVTFKVVTDTVNVRDAAGGGLVAGQMLWFGSRIDFRASSCTDTNGFYWWEQADKPGWWSASGSTDGKQVFMLPATAEDNADSIRRLEVPWVSQLDRNAPDGADCGPSCVLMLLRYYGKVGADVYVKDLSKYAPGYTSVNQLQTVAGKFGLQTVIFNMNADTAALKNLRGFLRNGKPVILLVRYKPLGFSNPYQRNQNIDHWVTLSGFDGDTFFVHDPLWLSWDKGTFLRVTSDRLLNACAQSVSLPNKVYGLY